MVRAHRADISLIALLGAVAAACWAVTVDRMRGMDAGPNTDPGTLGFFISIWVVMMVAMMLPSAAPMIGVYARLAQSRAAIVSFAGGYLALWTGAGVVAYGLAVAARRSDVVSWDNGGRYVVAAVVAAAAVYQLTPLKQRCLARCRAPLGFVVTNWREGVLGAGRMGVVHGAWCLGCCWALMASLLALGVMSVTWMVVVALLIAGEKLLPWNVAARGGVALLMVALAVAIALAPGAVPGLTLPGMM